MSLAAPYSPAEEAANALTHGAGLLLGVSALTHILHVLPLQLTARQTAGVLTYSISLVLMFLASTLYHAVSQIRVKQILKRCDHCAIYLLIAGTATPLLTIAVQNSAASILLIVIWSMAAVGVGFKLFFAGRFKVLSTATYVLMGALLLLSVIPSTWLCLPAALRCYWQGVSLTPSAQVFIWFKKSRLTMRSGIALCWWEHLAIVG